MLLFFFFTRYHKSGQTSFIIRSMKGIQVSVPPKDTPGLLKGWAFPFRLLVVLCIDAYMQLYSPNTFYAENVVKHHLYDMIFY